MDNKRVEELALSLRTAEQSRRPIDILTRTAPELSEEDAYCISRLNVTHSGKRVVGFKLGYTSAAMRAQMGVTEPNYGYLTVDREISGDKPAVDIGSLIHPLIEPEITVVTRRELSGGGHTRASVYPAVEAIAASLEIVDTRYREYKFTAVDNISDNSSSARFVLGPLQPKARVEDARLIGAILWSGGRALDQGIGANALGDPLLALAWLVNALARREQTLPAGSIILTGGLTKAYRAQAGETFIAELGNLGIAQVTFTAAEAVR